MKKQTKHNIGKCGEVCIVGKDFDICAECGKKVKPKKELKKGESFRIGYQQGKKEAREELKKELIAELLKTKDENFAFMTMTNEKGELEDWTIPVTEAIKIVKN